MRCPKSCTRIYTTNLVDRHRKNVPGAKLYTREDQAAKVLAKYLKEITSVNVPVILVSPEAMSPVNTNIEIHVGYTPFVRKFDHGLEKLKRGGYIIKHVPPKKQGEPHRLILAGRSTQATRYCVYYFLKKYCGVYLLMPGDIGKEVPGSKSLNIPWKLSVVRNPDYDGRGASDMPDSELSLSLGLPSRGHYDYGHNLYKIYPRSKYSDRPEYYAMINGKRSIPKNDREVVSWDICLTNPDVIKTAVEYSDLHFFRDPDAASYSLSENDGGKYCSCEKCLPLDVKGNPMISVSDRRWQFVNKVAQGVAVRHPGKKVTAYAYILTCIAPTGFKLSDNVMPILTPGINLGWPGQDSDDIFGYIDNWAKVCKSFGMHTYRFGAQYLPFRTGYETYREILRYAHDRGAEFVTAEIYPAWGSDAAKVWIYSQLLWDLDTEVDELLQEFCDVAYGPAGAVMQSFYKRWDDVWDRRPFRYNHYRFSPDDLAVINAEDIAYWDNQLAMASDLVKTDKQIKRLEMLEKIYHFHRFDLEAELITRKVSTMSEERPEVYLNRLCSIVNKVENLRKESKTYFDEVIAKQGFPYLASSINLEIAYFSGARVGQIRRENAKIIQGFAKAFSNINANKVESLYKKALSKNPQAYLYIQAGYILQSETAKSENLCVNSGFEQIGNPTPLTRAKFGNDKLWQKSNLTGWWLYARKQAYTRKLWEVSQDKRIYKNGNNSVRIDGLNRAMLIQNMPVKPGKWYLFTGWVQCKKSDRDLLGLSVAWRNANSADITLEGHGEIARLTKSLFKSPVYPEQIHEGQWQRLVLLAKAPQEAVTVLVGFGGRPIYGNESSSWLDDVGVYEIQSIE